VLNTIIMRFLFFFLDGVGLGQDNPRVNPFARVDMPNLNKLLGGNRLLNGSGPIEGERCTLIPLDACLGVDGLPQSATGQATLLTGINVPARLGYHYGPKPNQPVANILRNGNLFSSIRSVGKSAALLNAYPTGYFEGIRSGRRLYSAIPLAVTSAGIDLLTEADLRAGRALSADFTAEGWREHLGIQDAPLLNPYQAGERLGDLCQFYDFAFFEYWISDYAGHRQDMDTAGSVLGTFDQVLEGLLASWDDEAGLILITSDHGNFEDMSTRRHTANPVPALVIGSAALRAKFTDTLSDLTHVAGGITNLLI
jgi:2,3-bisphosphoglycerate-independent phosphoglycerate mutase